ncbi:PilZ domain-containing protein [Muricoccus aerilatus]|uniref:PilZ domain-containing protein n=1 Tax=Muricoccus aerilatus TaxID=452982 RepID=UPI0005C1E1E4|nr:PilZ domain-containing protein [Roseomonas aerilata]
MQDGLNAPGDDSLSLVVAEALKRMLTGREPAQAPAELLQTLRWQLAKVLAEAPMTGGDVAEIDLRARLACVFEQEISKQEALAGSTSTGSHPALGYEERRRWPRYQVHLRAQLLSGAGSFDCTVIDLSEGGAQIDVAESIPLSAIAVLNIEDGATYVARRRWVNGTRAGFEFTGAPLVSGGP